MTEGNFNNLNNGRNSPEQSVSNQAVVPSFHLHCLSRSNLGFGIGKYHGSYFFIWIITCLFYVGPFIITYTLIALTAFAIFLPICRIIRCLGC